MVKQFNLEIYTPDRTFFSGIVQGVVVTTHTGEIGILANALPFVSILSSGVIKIQQSGNWIEGVTSQGFISVEKNQVTIFAEKCYWSNELNLLEHDEDEQELMDRKTKKEKSLKEYQLAKAQLAIQFAKLKRKGRDK